MTEETAAGFQREGDIAFPTETTAKETGADSHSGDDNQNGETHSEEGDNNTPGDNKNIPFHEHPRWKQREDEWNTRFNDQEKRHTDELTKAIDAIRTEIGDKRADNAAQTKIPAWFGGTQEQWDAYKADHDAELKAIGDEAEKRAVDRIKREQEKEGKAVEEATAFLRSELAAMKADKDLNPSGAKIDAEKLWKVVLDNKLIDTEGRWNYRAGMRILNGMQAAPAKKPDTTDKKQVAAASTSGGTGGGDPKPKSYMTSADFKKDRPW